MKLFVKSIKRVVIECLCGTAALATVACGDGRGVPTSPSASGAVSSLAATAPRGASTVQALAAPATPFNGTLSATEEVTGNAHQLTGVGIGTQLGNFTYAASIVINEDTLAADGTVVWTAANGDRVNATMHGEVVGFEYPIITIVEQQVVTGGTGRFANASGSIVVNRTLNLETSQTSGSFKGTVAH